MSKTKTKKRLKNMESDVQGLKTAAVFR
jgi:hypothetical protein